MRSSNTATGLCEILVISAAAGFIMALFQVSGLAFAFAAYLVDLGGTSLIALLVLAAVVSIILGMGLPTIGVYIMLAILVAPALVKVGVPPLAAHLFILYFGMMSLITPPVAPAAYVAAAIAGSPSMATGWTAMRFGWSSYIVPFLFVYSPAILMKGSVLGHRRGDAHLALRHLADLRGDGRATSPACCLSGRGASRFVAAGIMLLLPHQASPLMLWLNIAGAALGIALLALRIQGKEALMFVRNAWYVAAWDHEVTRAMQRRVILDEPVRALPHGRRHAGRARRPLLPPAGAALDGQADRQHRQLPLSRAAVRYLRQMRQGPSPGHGPPDRRRCAPIPWSRRTTGSGSGWATRRRPTRR